MKKNITLITMAAALLLCLPAAGFAQLQLGPTALYNWPISEDAPDTGSLGLEDFTFGADLRLRLAFLHIGAMALFTPGGVDVVNLQEIPSRLDVFSRLGIQVELAILRVSAGIGPTFGFDFYATDDSNNTRSMVGGNAMASLELVLGKVAVAANYLVTFDFGFDEGTLAVPGTELSRLGLSVLFEF